MPILINHSSLAEDGTAIDDLFLDTDTFIDHIEDFHNYSPPSPINSI